MLTLAAFLIALVVLIAVHEYGHYRMAVACGVKVIRFSIGFGKTLFRWQRNDASTEFVICAVPLGGYVKMLDEHEASVPADQRHLAFNTQPLRSRFAIVAAGPLANLLLAVLLYSAVNWLGVDQARAILARPADGSIAALAGLVGGERIARGGFDGDELNVIESFDELRWLLTRGAMERQDVHLGIETEAPNRHYEVVLKLATLESNEVNADLFRKIGIAVPFSRPVIGELVAESPAQRAGLKPGDLVLQVGSAPIIDAQQLRSLIRASVANKEAVSMVWKVERDGAVLDLNITPEARQDGEQLIGRIGAFVGATPEMVLVRYGAADGLWQGAVRTWNVSILSVKMVGKMLLGEASVKNLSGPLSMAEYAGKSAGLGLTSYLTFLALISVSLGVLNLLPLPVLDGGYLMYYLWEGATGKPVSEALMSQLQKGGIAILIFMMSIALFNDMTRLVG
jgi:regulator of sigma E protease